MEYPFQFSVVIFVGNTRSTSHLLGLKAILKPSPFDLLTVAGCRGSSVGWSGSPDDLILLYRRHSSANSLVVDLTDDSKSLLKSRNNRGPRTVPWGTPDETVLADDV
jgi:hypothetical protein